MSKYRFEVFDEEEDEPWTSEDEIRETELGSLIEDAFEAGAHRVIVYKEE